MIRYAIYVEGKAEMLLVADILKKYSDYNHYEVGFQCINLNNDKQEHVTYPRQGSTSSKKYYQIVNVNNDNLVVTRLKNDIPNLLANNFNVIIGLRDVFGENYDILNKGEHKIDDVLIDQMYKEQSQIINKDGDEKIRLHFAIMEYETWMMALLKNFVERKGYNYLDVLSQLNIDAESDFEKTIFHPANIVKKIYELIGEKYGKHAEDQLSFLATLEKEDYEWLRSSGKCVSFCSFMDSLLNYPNEK